MDLWLIVVIAFGAALVLGFGIVLRRARVDAAGATPPASSAPAAVLDRPDLDDAVRTLLAEGKLIPAVKLVRERTGFGLKDAKEYVDRLQAGLPAPAASARPSADAVTPEAMAHIQQLVAQGKKIQAIKVLREHTGLGLKQAKDTVERMEESGVVAALDVAGPAADPTDDVMGRVQALVAQGKKLQAIKLLLENAPELDLRRAKEIVDRM